MISRYTSSLLFVVYQSRTIRSRSSIPSFIHSHSMCCCAVLLPGKTSNSIFIKLSLPGRRSHPYYFVTNSIVTVRAKEQQCRKTLIVTSILKNKIRESRYLINRRVETLFPQFPPSDLNYRYLPKTRRSNFAPF